MLRGRHCVVGTYPFSFKVSSHFPSVIKNLSKLYPESLLSLDGAADFNVAVNMPIVSGVPLLQRSLFYLDGFTPFTRAPKAHSYALLEWGMNWCVSRYGSERLIIHAACVAKGNNAILLTGDSGSGKSTLSCALMNESYRLLTDELSLINIDDGLVTPFVRPVSLKDGSIRLINERYPLATIGKVAFNTHKGTVSHCRPSVLSWENMKEKAEINGIVFPKFRSSVSSIQTTKMTPIEAFTKLSEQAFNIHILGSSAIYRLQQICEAVPAYEITYSNTEDAIRFVNTFYESSLL